MAVTFAHEASGMAGGGVHAREWIAPAVASWILHALVEGENGSGKSINHKYVLGIPKLV